MILPGHLNQLLKTFTRGQILLVDLRSPADFQRSHIHGALNLRVPLSFVKATTLDMIQRAFTDEQSRRTFSKWNKTKCVVFYDRAAEFTWECPAAEALLEKFKRDGWSGRCFILKGHYREFSASFDKYIAGMKMTAEAKTYIDSLRDLSAPTEVSVGKSSICRRMTNRQSGRDKGGAETLRRVATPA